MTAWSSGMLNQRVTFRRVTMTGDGVGGATTTWTDLFTLWACVQPLRGREREQSMRDEARADYLIVVRNRDDLRATDVAEWRGRTLNLRFIRDRGPRTGWLEIEAELGAPGS